MTDATDQTYLFIEGNRLKAVTLTTEPIPGSTMRKITSHTIRTIGTKEDIEDIWGSLVLSDGVPAQ